jgi:hypothetical protein
MITELWSKEWGYTLALLTGMHLGPTAAFLTWWQTNRRPFQTGLSSSRLGELHFYVATIFLRHFEQRAGLKIHEPRNEDIWQLLYPNVVSVHVVVEELTSVGNLLLELGDAALQ